MVLAVPCWGLWVAVRTLIIIIVKLLRPKKAEAGTGCASHAPSSKFPPGLKRKGLTLWVWSSGFRRTLSTTW